MFEKFVVEFLKRFFGDYFANLNTEHLNLSLWQGDVVLKDLVFKSNAFDSLKLPFKVHVGKIGELKMRLPWKTIYVSPVELSLYNLYMVIVPGTSAPYNAELEQQAALAIKMRLLTEIEETRRAMQSQESVVVEGSSFKEKLMMHIIRNVQIKVESIHIRYEDDITTPLNPFNMGIVLKYLYVETTNASWEPNFFLTPVPTIYKKISLSELGLYMGAGDINMMSKKIPTTDKILSQLQLMIQDATILRHKYVVGPVSMVLKLQMTPSPENTKPAFSVPKISIEVFLNELSLGISNVQFINLLYFLDGINLLTQARKWRKYRPTLNSYVGHAKVWWRFAFDCVMEEVRRRRRNWDWKEIKARRGLYKSYYQALFKKQIQNNSTPQLDTQIKQLENDLDNFNIVLARKQIEMKKERKTKIENERRRNAGWLGSLLGMDTTSGVEFGAVEAGWNDEEKAKLEEAIGFSSKAANVNCPDEYVEFKLNFRLYSVNVLVQEFHNDPVNPHLIPLLTLKLENFVHVLQYRPVSNGLKTEWKMDDIEVSGVLNAKNAATCIIKTKKQTGEHFFEVCFERKPLNLDAEKIIRLKAKALEIVYHAETTTQIVKSFTPPSEVRFSRIQAKAMNKINQFKSKTSASLRRMVHTKGELVIEIDFMAPYFIIPQDGDLDRNGSVLIIDLGKLKVRTQGFNSISKANIRSNSAPPSKPTSRHGSRPTSQPGSKSSSRSVSRSSSRPASKASSKAKFKAIVQKHVIISKTQVPLPPITEDDERNLTPAFINKFYETYDVRLKDFRVLLALSNEDYKLALKKSTEKSFHLLRLNEISLTVHQSLLASNPNAPKYIAKVSLPFADLEITEDRLVQLIRILTTLPIPNLESGNEYPQKSFDTEIDASEVELVSELVDRSGLDLENAVQITNLVLDTHVDFFRIYISRPDLISTVPKPLIAFELRSCGLKTIYKSFGITVEFKLVGISLCALSHSMPGNYGPLYLIQAPTAKNNDKPLLNVHMFFVAENCPKSVQNPIKLQITNEVASIDIILHEEVLLTLMTFGDEVISQLSKDVQDFLEQKPSVTGVAVLEGATTEATTKSVPTPPTKYKGNPNDILMQCWTKMESLTIQLSTDKKNIIKVGATKLDISFNKTPTNSDFKFKLAGISCSNLDSESSYKNMLSVEGDQILTAHIIRFHKKGVSILEPDMKLSAQTGSPTVICIGSCVKNVINFVDHFRSVTKVIKEASRAAGENVKLAMRNDYKILVDIHVIAPKIIFPKDGKSNHAILADLGNLTLQNAFKLVKTDSPESAVLDEMVIHLKSVQLSRVDLDLDTHAFLQRRALMEPVSFNAKLCRNLSSEWYYKIPAVGFAGIVNPTVLCVSGEDYDLTLTALLNFIAGFKHNKSHKPLALMDIQSKKNIFDDPVSVQKRTKSDLLKLSFKITFEELGINLYFGPGQEKVQHSNLFAKFSVTDVNVEFREWNKYRKDVDVAIGAIGFKDCRENASTYADLISRAKATSDPVLRFTTTFSLTPEGQRLCQVDFKMQSLILVVCLDYLVQVARFLATPTYGIPNLESGINMRKLSRGINDSFKKLQREFMKINFDTGELELALVEDMNAAQTNAIIFNFQTIAEVSRVYKELRGAAKSKLQVKTCNHSPALRNSTSVDVISPTEMNVILSNTKGSTTSTDVEVEFSDTFIRLSAGTVNLFTRISKSWNYAADMAESEARKEIDNSGIWDAKSTEGLDYWFLSEADPNVPSAVPSKSNTSLVSLSSFSEHLVVRPVSVVVTFEIGADSETTPLLMLDILLDLQCYNWSEKIILTGLLNFTLACNNTKYGAWEYIVEPVEAGQYGTATHKPWEANFVISKSNHGAHQRDGESQASLLDKEDDDQMNVHYIISIQSNDIFEITLSQTGFEVIENLIDAFKSASKSLLPQRNNQNYHYAVFNDSGVDIQVDFVGSHFKFARGSRIQTGKLALLTGEQFSLFVDDTAKYSILRGQQEIQRKLKISIPEFHFAEEIPVNRVEGRFYPFSPNSRQGLFCDARAKNCSVVVTLRGVFQIVNHVSLPISVYCHEEGEPMKLIGNVPEHGSWNIPLKVSSKHCQYLLAPKDCTPEAIPTIDWSPNLKSKKLEGPPSITFKPKSGSGATCTLKVINEVRKVLLGGSNRSTDLSKVCITHIRAALVILNSLPMPLTFSVESQSSDLNEINPGGLFVVTATGHSEVGEHAFFLKVKIEGRTLSCSVLIKKSTPDLSTWNFEGKDAAHFQLGIHKHFTDEIATLQVFCNYWMINYTGILLIYQAEGINDAVKVHPPDYKGPLLFTVGINSTKNRASIKCSLDCAWSDKFYLDVAGSSTVISRSPKKDFQVEVTVSLPKAGLTKLITFKPRFQVINRCSYEVLAQETEFPNETLSFDTNKCVPFWPRSKIPTLTVRIKGTEDISNSVSYNRIQNTVLKLKNQYGGIHVHVHVSRTRTAITFSEYVSGQAPALLVNATENTSIDFGEVGVDEKFNILPKHCQLFTWSHPSKERTLTCTPASTPKVSVIKDNLLVDSSGQWKTTNNSGEEVGIYWMSFLEGFQRILLFTENEKLAKHFTTSQTAEEVKMEIALSLGGLGVSLVNSETGKDILYLRISSSGILWEINVENISNLYLPLGLEASILDRIEKAYQKYIEEKNVSNVIDSLYLVNPEFELNFENMTTTKPEGRQLRRSPVQPGISINFKKLRFSKQVQVKINSIQIDNQLNDCSFRYICNPVMPPKSMVPESDPMKPFVNLTLMQRSSPHSKVVPSIYCSALIQEFDVRVDMGLINAIVALVKTRSISKAEQMVKNFDSFYASTNTTSEEFYAGQVHNSAKLCIEKLHLSPIKVHLSFSMSGSAQDTDPFLSLLVQNIGNTLTDVQDVVLKLACLELRHMYLTHEQLREEIRYHYVSQAIKQFYSLVLGLNVLGNPISLVSNVSEGIQAFFYEPIQGMIQGPSEFAEGLTIGVKSLVGHTIGGAAGALSKITGTFGNGLAFLTLDSDFQKKRQEVKAQRSREGIASYTKTFLKTGILDTVTGVVTSPIRGAQQEGISGFGLGLLRGTLGLVARPIAGAADLAAGTLDSLQRAAQPKKVLTQVRPPRNLEPDMCVQPYVRQTAEGILILHELKVHRDDLGGENYVAHIVVGKSKNEVLLITTNCAFYLTLRDMFGASSIQWEHRWEDFLHTPDIIEHERGIAFRVKGNGVKGLLKGREADRLFIPITDAKICLWIITKIEETMTKRKEATAATTH